MHPHGIDQSNDSSEKLDDVEVIRQLGDSCVYLGVEGVRRDSQTIEADQQKSVAERIERGLLGTKPESWDELQEWLAGSAVLSVLDPRKHAKLNKSVVKNVQAALEIIEKSDFNEDDDKVRELYIASGKEYHEKDLTDPLTRLSARLVKLYQLIGIQASPECKQLCIQKFTEWERQMNEKNAEGIPTFLQEQIESSERIGSLLRPFTKELMKMTLDDFADKGQYPTIRTKLEEDDGEFFYSTKNSDGKSRTWRVENYSADGVLFTFRSIDEEESGLGFTIDMMDGFHGLVEDDPQLIDMRADDAVADYKKEHGKEQQKILNGYDLPKDRKLAHVRLFPQAYDDVVSKGLQSSMLLSTALKTHYGDAVITRPPLFVDDPEQALRQEIQDVFMLNGEKPTHFCIDVFSHGSKDHFVFWKQLEAKHVVQIAKDFPQCSFTYNTNACYGAGMMKGTLDNADFANDKELQSRLAVFTQSKGDSPNMVAYSTASSMYYVYLTQELYAGKSYGEAHRMADIEAKKHLPVDAEGIIHGKKLVLDKPMQSHKV